MPGIDDLRRGACPSAGSPMASGDGLVSRVRLPSEGITNQQLAALATQTERLGQGVVELTNRGNIQVRGLTESSELELTEWLVSQELAAADPATEAARNLQTSPVPDLDPEALFDTRPLAVELDSQLQAHADFQALPPKFRFVINAGGQGHLGDVDGDIRADAMATDDGTGFRIGLAGTGHDAHYLGIVAPDAVVATLTLLTHCFLDLNRRLVTPMRRLAGHLEREGEAPFRAAINAPPGPVPKPVDYGPTLQPGALGNAFTAGVPFGRLDAATARAIAAISDEAGGDEVRITPWRQVVIPGNPDILSPQLEDLDLITSPADPRASLVACVGSPECQSGTTQTRKDALNWAKAVPELFESERRIHVSGCSKGCAHRGGSPITLTAHDGLYDIILNDSPFPENEDNRVFRNRKPSEIPEILRSLNRGTQSSRNNRR